MSETFDVAVPNLGQIDEECVAAFTESFNSVDKDRNGTLDKKEFKKFMEHANQAHQSKYMFNIIDVNKDGRVSLEEFLKFGEAMWDVVTKGDMRKYMKMIFDACAQTNKNELNQDEFVKFLKYTGTKVGVFERKKVFKKYDRDGSGTISFDEIMKNINFVMAGMQG